MTLTATQLRLLLHHHFVDTLPPAVDGKQTNADLQAAGLISGQDADTLLVVTAKGREHIKALLAVELPPK